MIILAIAPEAHQTSGCVFAVPYFDSRAVDGLLANAPHHLCHEDLLAEEEDGIVERGLLLEELRTENHE